VDIGDKAQMLPYALFYRKDQLDVVASEKDRLLADKEEEIAAKQGELEEKEALIQELEKEISESKECLAEIESTVDEVAYLIFHISVIQFSCMNSSPVTNMSTVEQPCAISSRRRPPIQNTKFFPAKAL